MLASLLLDSPAFGLLFQHRTSKIGSVMNRNNLIKNNKAVLLICYATLIAIAAVIIALSSIGAGSSAFLFLVFLMCFAVIPASLIWIYNIGKTRYSHACRICCMILYSSIVVSVPMTNWPLRVSFVINQAALEQLADQTRNGSVQIEPCRIGPFKIWRTSLEGTDISTLWLDKNGDTKLVRYPTYQVDGYCQLCIKRRINNLWILVTAND